LTILFLILSYKAFLEWKHVRSTDALLFLISHILFTAALAFWTLSSVLFQAAQPRPLLNTLFISSLFVVSVSLYIVVQYRYWRLHKALQAYTVNDLIRKFADGAESFVQLAESTDRNDATKAWKAFDEIKQAYYELERRDPSLKALMPLLNSASDAVRLFAARRLLGKVEKESLATLAQLSLGQGYVAFKASEMAQLWKDGKLTDITV
jgi:hypothetical protein